jgi:hypothetical protein
MHPLRASSRLPADEGTLGPAGGTRPPREVTMPGHDHGPSIKNPKIYEALRKKGLSKQRSARISNSAKKSGSSRTKKR